MTTRPRSINNDLDLEQNVSFNQHLSHSALRNLRDESLADRHKSHPLLNLIPRKNWADLASLIITDIPRNSSPARQTIDLDGTDNLIDTPGRAKPERLRASIVRTAIIPRVSDEVAIAREAVGDESERLGGLVVLGRQADLLAAAFEVFIGLGGDRRELQQVEVLGGRAGVGAAGGGVGYDVDDWACDSC